MPNSSQWSRLPAAAPHDAAVDCGPALSYWQDAWARLRANTRAGASLVILAGLLLFCLAGPLVWTVEPTAFNDIRVAPFSQLWADRKYIVVEASWDGSVSDDDTDEADGITVHGAATTHAVRLSWERRSWETSDCTVGYHIYRNIIDPRPDGREGAQVPEDPPLGVRLTTTPLPAESVSFEDTGVAGPGTQYYAVQAIGAGDCEDQEAIRPVSVAWGIAEDAEAEALLGGSLAPGDRVRLPWHPLGTDAQGRDMLARLMHGGRVSLGIGIATSLLAMLLGVCYGSVAGYSGGRRDQVMMRFADFVVGLPFLLVVILLYSIFGRSTADGGVLPMLIAMVALSWPGPARLVRGQVLQIRTEAYVSAAKLMGGSTSYLISRHIIPNTLGVILVTFTFAVPSAMFTEAFLSFIGVGIAPPSSSWGSICREGLEHLRTWPYALLLPATCISLAVLAFNLVGDGLRDALDARMRSRE